MICTKEDLKRHIHQDRIMNGVPEQTSLAYKIVIFFFVSNLIIRCLCYLRKEEFYTNRRGFYASYICIKTKT